MLCVQAGGRAEMSDAEKKNAEAFDGSLVVVEDGRKGGPLAEEDQRPLVNARFAALKTAGEKQAFLMWSQAVQGRKIHLTLFGECAIKLLKDDDAGVRRDAAIAIGRGLLEQHSAAVEALKDDPDPDVRHAVVVSLGYLGRLDLTGWMAEMAKPERELKDREAALAGLGGLLISGKGTAKERNSVLAVIARYLDITAPVEIQRAAVAAATYESRQRRHILPHLIKMMESKDEEVRYRTMLLIRDFQDNRVAAPVLRAFDDPSARVRHLAVSRLNMKEAKALFPKLVKLLEDPDAGIREAAIHALAMCGEKQAADPISLKLADKTPVVRARAAFVLGQLKADKYAAQVASLLEDADRTVVLSALSALKEIGTKDQVPAVFKAMRSEDEWVRTACARALVNMGDEAAPILLGALGDSSANVRLSAVAAIYTRKQTGAAASVAKLLEDPDANVRALAVRTLVALAPKDHVDAIVAKLADESAVVREETAWAMQKLGSRKHAAAVATLLGDKESRVKRTALDVLKDIGGKEQAEAVVAFAKGRDDELAEKAIRVLEAVDAREYREVLGEVAKESGAAAIAARAVLEKWDRN
jgi:HEAT repeat protein